MKNEIKIQEGQRITFKYRGSIYTKKVIQVITTQYNNLTSYNVNPIGCGTMYVNVEHQEVISVK